MDETNLRRVKSNYPLLVETLDVEPVADILFSKSAISNEEYEYIVEARTRSEKTRKLVRYLLKKSDTEYEIFLHACVETEQPHVVEQLNSTDLSNYSESTYKNALDNTENLVIMQEQLFKQTKQMLSFQQSLFSFTQQYPKIVEFLKSKGLKEEKAITMLNSYMASGTGTGTMTVDGRLELQKDLSSDIYEALARDLGRDIVLYMCEKERREGVRPPSTRYAATMRRMVDKMIEEYKYCFQNFFSQLPVEKVNGYQTFIDMSDVLLANNVNNWGRVVALYAFMGWIAQTFAHQPHVLVMLGDFFGFYVAQKLGPWIRDHGGWDAFELQYSQDKPNWVKDFAKVAGLVGTGVVIGVVMTRKA